MRYLEIKTGPWSDEPSPWWLSILEKIIPAASPDLEQYYNQTSVWWLEIDDQGLPQREIGFDSDLNPVVLGPIGENLGFLIDSCDDWSDSSEDSKDAARLFEKKWNIVFEKFKHLEKESSQQRVEGDVQKAAP